MNTDLDMNIERIFQPRSEQCCGEEQISDLNREGAQPGCPVGLGTQQLTPPQPAASCHCQAAQPPLPPP